MMKMFACKCIPLLFCLLLMQGCVSEHKNQSQSELTQTPKTVQTQSAVSLNLDMESVFSQRISSTYSPQSIRRAVNNQSAMGELKITNLSDNSVQVVSWPITYDVDVFELTSNKTIVLSPGNYDFEFLVEIDNHQYVGVRSAVSVNDSDKLALEMVLQAVLGDTSITVDQINDLPSFKLVYPEDELLELLAPKLGVIIDNGNEVILNLAPQSDNGNRITEQYLSISEGNHSIQIALYDDNKQVGKSVVAQEQVVVVAGEALSINLVPLSGEVAILFEQQGGNAFFSLTFPNTVFDEVESVDQLNILLKMSGVTNNPGDVLMTNLIDNGDGTSTVTYTHSDLNAEAITLALEFYDNANEDLLASCLLENLSLDKNDRSLTCNIELVRRSIIQGHVMATLGILSLIHI